MHIRSILAIARKDALDIILNKSTFFALLTPIFMAILFTVISNLISAKTTNILIYDPGNSGVDKVISSALASPNVTHARLPDDVMAAFGPDGTHKKSSYAVGIIVPANFIVSLQKGLHPQVNLYLNGDETSETDREVLVRLLTSYASAIVNPQPITISTATINPSTTTAIVDLKSLYIAIALLSSFLVGTSIVPSLLVEEKEKKTIRMLMVSPASFTDIVMGKLLIGLMYQILLSGIVLTVMKGFIGNIPALLLIILLGSCFSLALGLAAGSIFQNMNALGAFTGIVSMIFIIPAIFTGPLGTLLSQGNQIIVVIKILPTYYIAQGIYEALQNQSMSGDMLLNAGIVFGCVVVLLAGVSWLLRRQAAVTAML